jgi:ribose transport system substrate-binding protein
MKKTLAFALLALLLIALVGPAAYAKDSYRFVIVPKVVHPWFDKVHEGALQMAEFLSQQTGKEFIIDYRAPSVADVVMQNNIIEQAAATRPDGIAIDLLDGDGNRAVIESVMGLGIPVVIFDSEAPADLGLLSIGNDFAEQAAIAAERLVELLGGKGKVAIMQGVPTAPNHRIRYEAHKATLAKYPGIEIVAEGIDNDDIETAQQQAAAILAAHPDLDGFLSCNAAGPIGIGLAIREAGRAGRVLSVGMDDLDQLLVLIEEGVVDSSSSTKPYLQGQWTVLSMWLAREGMPLPKTIDTGIAIITRDNLDTYQSE